ncbi:MAG: glycosyltransferase [Longilinea sp.]|nr:glycosyltransferase [Longilinea sp.]MCA1954363.1 glycosyltransferase [Anaerolinea sp.]
MRICIASTNFPRWAGDFRVPFIYEAAKAVQQQGHFVRVVTMHAPGAKEYESFDGLEVVRLRYLPERWEVLQRDAAGIPAAWKANPWARLALLPFALRFAQGLAQHAADCDLIHANWTLSAMAAWVSAPFHRRPYLVTVQGSDIFTAPRIPLVKSFTRLALNRAEHVLALSSALAQATVALGVDATRVRVLPNGVNVQRFPFLPDVPRQPWIVFVGSLIERKGVRYLLQAMPIVLAECPTYRLIIIGEGEQAAELQQLSQRLQLGDRVQFVGTQSQAQVGEWLRQARLFVLPSIEEGQGVVLLEALASGTPCVGSAVGGIQDVITEAVGQLVPPQDATALAQAMITVLQAQDWDRLSSNARRRIEEVYDWKNLAMQLVSMYQQVLTHQVGARRE